MKKNTNSPQIKLQPTTTAVSPWVGMEYWPNGKVKSETTLVNGLKQGIQTLWGENGNKERQEIWVEGKKHGTATGWWDDAQKWTEITWKDGKIYGIRTEWRRSGAKKWEMYYSHDEVYAGIEWDEEENVDDADLPPQRPTSLSPSTTNPITKLKNHIGGWVT